MSDLCPCCSGKLFADCCEPYVSGKKRAPTPEALMRSRYTAFTLADVVYLSRTMRGKAKEGMDYEGTKTWAKSVDWKGLEVSESKIAPSGKRGIVEFVASFEEDSERKTIAERSEFRKHKGYWYYTDRV